MISTLLRRFVLSFLFLCTVASANYFDDNYCLTKPTRWITNLASDTANLFINFVDLDTVKTFIFTFPLYAAGQAFDERLHHCFYDMHHHKNINKCPSIARKWADTWAIRTVAAVNAGFLFLSKNERLRQTSKMFLIGLPFLVLTTHAFKHVCYGEFCLRPLHDKFCPDHIRKRGGFPSTHAGDFAFATTLFALQFGPRAAVPLGLVGGAVLCSFVNDNRHYLSQIIAGAGLGVVFAFAADKVVNKNLARDLNMHIDVTPQGSPALALSWKF
ncbi:MAG: phosphatase PAP2 family protein [Candidatus Dependentiae bacterium]|nr:phosphatase PAP2 family protein [Candidatus Dependentiae bacterium]